MSGEVVGPRLHSTVPAVGTQALGRWRSEVGYPRRAGMGRRPLSAHQTGGGTSGLGSDRGIDSKAVIPHVLAGVGGVADEVTSRAACARSRAATLFVRTAGPALSSAARDCCRGMVLEGTLLSSVGSLGAALMTETSARASERTRGTRDAATETHSDLKSRTREVSERRPGMLPGA